MGFIHLLATDVNQYKESVLEFMNLLHASQGINFSEVQLSVTGRVLVPTNEQRIEFL